MEYTVEIYLGSESDRQALDASGALNLLQKIGIGYRVSIVSAHRNLGELQRDCGEWSSGSSVVIAAAGMSAALPGAIAAITNGTMPVIGVPLPSEYDPEAKAALYSMLMMPPGRPVMVAGIGRIGFTQAVLAAAQIVGSNDPDTYRALSKYQVATTKPAQPGVEAWSPE